jgi:hypothetical protein
MPWLEAVAGVNPQSTPAASIIIWRKTMRPGILSCIAAIAVLAGCAPDGEAPGGTSSAIAVRDATGCDEAAHWRQRSAEARSQGLQSSGDQARTNHINRANFFASMAVAADLQCIVTSDEGDQPIAAALEAARNAEAARSFYEQTRHWGEAHHAALQAIEVLVQRIPPQNGD